MLAGLHAWRADGAVLWGASAATVALFIVFASIFPEKEITFLLFFVLPIRVQPKLIAWLLVALSSTPVAVLVSWTVTLGMTAWVVSCTVPRTLPLLDCGHAGAARKTSKAAAEFKGA